MSSADENLQPGSQLTDAISASVAAAPSELQEPRQQSSGDEGTASQIQEPVYFKDGLDQRPRCGEIISRVAQYEYDVASGEVEEVYHEYAIVVTQDCDLERQWDAMNKVAGERPRQLNGVLFLEAQPAEFAKQNLPPNLKWRDLVNNNTERYAYLEACPPECDLKGSGFPSLLVDFRRYFTMGPDAFQRQIKSLHQAQRRTRLRSPYAEHLQTRLAAYMFRVAIPRPHVKPSSGNIAAP